MKHKDTSEHDALHDMLVINEQQKKLLQSALRITIMHALGHEPRTAKQVADQLHKTPGNVHYHIQRLYEGGLLELADTRTQGGIVEKYYKAKGTRFHYPGSKEDGMQEAESVMDWFSRLHLSAEELKEFRKDLITLLERWEKRTGESDEYAVSIRVARISSEQYE
ncbi:helix-turn-helix domain-containing protein [Paenibacillus sp. P96]|uniref:Helix-turn-helix domain-containing protein n=1 Tax=Paenibacillus zeirhizosphaerae TaxID=2987519 RepID=A0ABT9FV29_9BACL|nr:winged helix-turn-helix domain-containing protein [Paenibacillus sp. P96]MDP4098366.1 helix-turn-helix domain-containing protein [Paenibacillus sp. P96]